MDHSSKNVPNLRNLLMEMRKLCCHPYLCNGLEVGTCAHKQNFSSRRAYKACVPSWRLNTRLLLGNHCGGLSLFTHKPALLWTNAACAGMTTWSCQVQQRCHPSQALHWQVQSDKQFV